jgi:hypothetical protein
MKDAAKRVVNTLGVSDYFAVIQFNTYANILGNDQYMIRATAKNKAKMINEIDGLRANGGTYFKNGFDLAFDTFDASFLVDRSSGCKQAILFLSDGELSDNASVLKTVIKAEREKYTVKGKDPPVLFTYSFGEGADDSVPKEIACENDGIWAKIGDGGDLASSMGAYYKYFAYGLGDKINENFVAWVEPYEFSSGVGLGTTASAPVYDRSVDPPVLAGVVGMDINFAALERVFGSSTSGSQSEVLERVVQRSLAYCPKLSVTSCQLESLREYGTGSNANSDASCSQCSSTIQPLKPPLCDYYPDQLWDNKLNKERTFQERTCCNVGADPRTIGSATWENVCVETEEFSTEELSPTSASPNLSLNAINSLLVGGVVAALV